MSDSTFRETEKAFEKAIKLSLDERRKSDESQSEKGAAAL
jgi:hypothetical protein